MRLFAQMLEDPRGRRSTNASLSLHGLGLSLEEAAVKRTSSLPGSTVEADATGHGHVHRQVARLDIVSTPGSLLVSTPRSVDLTPWLGSSIQGELLNAVGQWIQRGDFRLRYSREDRVAGEQEAVLQQLLEASQIRLRRRYEKNTLRLLRLDLADFRGIDQLTLDFCGHQTSVLAGVNGSGKSTLLDAAALLLAQFESSLTRASRPSRQLTDKDIMNGRELTRISVSAVIDGAPVTWTIAHGRGGERLPPEQRNELSTLRGQVTRLHEAIEHGDVHLPVVAFYPVHRAVLDIPLRIRTPHRFEPLEAYDGALTGDGRSFRLFFEWFRVREDLENELRIHDSWHRDHQLHAVRRAIEALMPGFSDLRVQRAPLGMLVNKGEWLLLVDQLSDGEKCLLAMAGDLARRLAMANPFLDDPLQGSGVVLIDEIELHLHPRWQREVIPALERTFPECQFILTTHSPAILSHVERDSVFLLRQQDGATTAANPTVSRGMDVNRVLLEIMGVDERPHEFKVRLERIYTMLGAARLAEAKAEIEKLESEIGSDPELTRASTLLRRKEILGR